MITFDNSSLISLACSLQAISKELKTNKCELFVYHSFDFLQSSYAKASPVDQLRMRKLCNKLDKIAFRNQSWTLYTKITRFIEKHFTTENTRAADFSEQEIRQKLIAIVEKYDASEILEESKNIDFEQWLVRVDGRGFSVLNYAVVSNDHELISNLLPYYQDTPECRKVIASAFTSAIGLGFLRCIQTFMDSKKIDLEENSHKGNTPLVQAIIGGQSDIAKFLVACGANINSQNTAGVTPLHWAIVKNRAIAFFLLSQSCIDVNLSDFEGRTALHYAIEVERVDLVKRLIRRGADVNTADGNGMSALMTAAELGLLECVKILLERKAKINEKRKIDEMAALEFAVKEGHEEVVEYLIEKGAFVNHSTSEVLFTLAIRHDQASLIPILIKRGADASVKYASGITPLIHAAGKGKLDSAKNILEYGEVDINAQDSHGNTALHRAIICGHADIIKFLIEQKAGLEIMSQVGYTALCSVIASDALSAIEKAEFIDQITKNYSNVQRDLDILMRKNLAQCWGLDGDFIVDNLTLQYGGDFRCQAAKTLMEGIDAFLMSLSAESPDLHSFFSEKEIRTITQFLEDLDSNISSKLVDSESLVQKIENGWPVAIMTGWLNHATAILFYKKVFKCNRGEKKDDFAVIGYEKQNKVTAPIIEKLRSNHTPRSRPAQIDYYKTGINQDLGLVEHTKTFFEMSDQFVSNCPSASLKAALYSLLQSLAQEHAQEVIRNDSEKRAKEAYKSMTSFMRHRKLKEYLETTPLELRNALLLRAIKEKALAKKLTKCFSADELKNYEKSFSLIEKLEVESSQTYQPRPLIQLIFNKIEDKIRLGENIDTAWKKVLKISSDVSSAGGINDFTRNQIALVQAIMAESREIFDFLIANGADVNQTNAQGYPPIFYALYLKREPFVQLLLNNRNIHLDKEYVGFTARSLAKRLKRPL